MKSEPCKFPASISTELLPAEVLTDHSRNVHQDIDNASRGQLLSGMGIVALRLAWEDPF